MKEFLDGSVFFALVLTLVTYEIGLFLKRKLKLAIFNPLLVSMLLSILAISALGLDFSKYKSGVGVLNYFLTPATVCLAVPLYEQFEKLKSNWKAVLGGIFVGALSSMTLIFLSTFLFRISHEEYVSLLPKSITTAIGLALAEQFAGFPAITAVAISVTGITGNVMCEFILRVFRITEPVAKGVAIGTASHALGTTKALEIGEVEGAMSSLSIAVAGLLTVVFAGVYANLY